MAKTLHYLADEGSLQLNDKQVLELGAGVGLVSIYLACLGSRVVMADVPALQDMAERNIGLNRNIIKGRVSTNKGIK